MVTCRKPGNNFYVHQNRIILASHKTKGMKYLNHYFSNIRPVKLFRLSSRVHQKHLRLFPLRVSVECFKIRFTMCMWVEKSQRAGRVRGKRPSGRNRIPKAAGSGRPCSEWLGQFSFYRVEKFQTHRRFPWNSQHRWEKGIKFDTTFHKCGGICWHHLLWFSKWHNVR